MTGRRRPLEIRIRKARIVQRRKWLWEASLELGVDRWRWFVPVKATGRQPHAAVSSAVQAAFVALGDALDAGRRQRIAAFGDIADEREGRP